MKNVFAALISALLAAFVGFEARAATPFQSSKWAHDADRDTVTAYNLSADLYDQTSGDPTIEALWSSLKILGADLGNGLDPKIFPGKPKANVRNYFHTIIDSDVSALVASANAVVPNHPELKGQIDAVEAWLSFLGECVDSEFGNDRGSP